jgi:hypothetical protein
MLLLAFANWRIAHLLASQEAGPYNILHRLRHFVGVRHSGNDVHGTNEFAQLFTCVWCMSLWTGLLLTLLLYFYPKLTKQMIMPFALSGMAILLEEKING